MGKSLTRLKLLGIYFTAALFLSGAAFYNGYPLIYPDTGGYIGLQNLSFRSFFYNLFIYPSLWFHSLWPVVFVQSLIVAHLVHLVLRVVFRLTSIILYLVIIVLLCLLTSLPWVTGFIMPDIFTGVMILSLYLSIFCRENLSLWEKGYLFLLTILSATVHLTHIPLAMGMIGVAWFFRIMIKNNDLLPIPHLLSASLAILLASVLIIANNYRAYGVFTFSHNGYAFPLARLIADGPAIKYLEESCPEKKYKLCAYLKELPSDSDKFLWSEDSPFRKVGGFNGYQKEGKEIVKETILSYPLDIIKQLPKNTFHQSIKFLTFSSSCLDKIYITHPIRSYFPREYQAYENSKQSQKRLDLKSMNYMHLMVVGISLMATVIIFLIFLKQSQYIPALCLLFIVVAYLIHALLTGCLSMPNHRYGNRIIWLLPFFSMASFMNIINYWKEYRQLIRYPGKPEIIAFIIGIFTCCCIIAIIEILLTIFHITESPYYRTDLTLYYKINAFGIKEPIPGSYRIHSERKKNGETIYDVSYEIDQFGRRVTPMSDQGHRPKFLLFFGCSLTYGEGVKSNETLPYYVGVFSTQYMPYNYGFHGLGPFDVLAKLETTDFTKEIKEKSGLVIYTFIDHHIERTFCPLSTFNWLRNQVYYDIPKVGHLIRKESFSSQFPFRMFIYNILSRSKLLKILKIDFPPRITKKHIENTARAIEEMDYYVKKRLPQSMFYVLFFPGQRYSDQLIPYLREKNIHYLNYSTLFDAHHDSRFFLAKEDKHASAFAYRTVARALVKELRLN
jgi:hypothetical protein